MFSIARVDPAPRRTQRRSVHLALTTSMVAGVCAGLVAFQSDPAIAASASGSVPPGATSYPIPAGAVFVAQSGSDANAGTVAHPVATVARALSKVASGGTVVIRGGRYHQSISVPDTRTSVTIQSYPGEAVWFDGSVAVTGWSSSGSRWIHSGWTTKFDASASFSRGTNDPSFIDPNYPMAAHPDQVWIDGVAQKQVSALSLVTAGRFFVDYTAHQIALGTNPSGHAVRASDTVRGFFSQAAHTTLRGIGFQRYAPSIPDMGAIRSAGAYATLENVVSSDNATTGISVRGTGVKLSHVTADRNGLAGMYANNGDALVIRDSRFDNNNTEHFTRKPVSGGVKITRSRTVTITRSDISHNTTNGLWFDESDRDVTIANNTVVGNGYYGIEAELSTNFIIAGNLIARNTNNGLIVLDAHNVQIWNNTFVGNWRQVNVYQDLRSIYNPTQAGHDPRFPNPDPTMSWTIGPIVLKNNIMVNENRDDYLFVEGDGTGTRTWAQIGLSADSNVYQAGTAGDALLANKSSYVQYRTVALLRAGTGQEAHGQQITTTAVTSTLTPNESVFSSSALATALPSNIALLVGQASGTRHLGSWLSL